MTIRRLSQIGLFMAVFTAIETPNVLGDDSSAWNPEAAGKYLDGRAKAWFAFESANRGAGATRTTCVSCHTLLPFALGRPALHKRTEPQTEFESKLIAQTKMRVKNWGEIDTAKIGLLYEFDDQKKKESWGTEAVLNAAILAFDDSYQGQTHPSEATKQAFANLWQVQAQTGDQKGSWNWLNFGLEPWEAPAGRYFGAALAAIAIGTAPGYSPENDAQVGLLRDYLKNGFAKQTFHNRLWALWASAKLDGILSKAERESAVRELLEKQGLDGGWRLSSIGFPVRKDAGTQSDGSDGYAAGLVLHVLQTAGVAKDDPKIAKGLTWLRKKQSPSGEWRAVSINKSRDPETHAGKFMSDAATAYAVLALSH